MQAPPDLMPDRFGVVGLAVLDQSGDFPLQDIGDRAAIAANRIGVGHAFGAIGIADPAGDEFERRDLAMRAVGERNGELDTAESGLDRLDPCHSVFLPGFSLQVRLATRTRQSLPAHRPLALRKYRQHQRNALQDTRENSQRRSRSLLRSTSRSFVRSSSDLAGFPTLTASRST